MNETAAHLVDDVLPRVPVRQWVLSAPHGLRHAMAHDPALTSIVCKEFLSAVSRWIRWRLRKQKVRGLLKTGAATAIQRFDSALALNVHFHALVLDGAYSLDAAGKPQFHTVAAPDDEDVAEVAMRVYTRVTKLFDVDQDAVGAREPAMAACTKPDISTLRGHSGFAPLGTLLTQVQMQLESPMVRASRNASPIRDWSYWQYATKCPASHREGASSKQALAEPAQCVAAAHDAPAT